MVNNSFATQNTLHRTTSHNLTRERDPAVTYVANGNAVRLNYGWYNKGGWRPSYIEFLMSFYIEYQPTKVSFLFYYFIIIMI